MTGGTRRPCLVCGIDCFWEPYDLQWSHMGWTRQEPTQAAPHVPEPDLRKDVLA
jgi:hypothetical protein